MAFIKKKLRPSTMERARMGEHPSVRSRTSGFKKETKGLRGGITEKVWDSRGIRRSVTSVRPAFFRDDIIKTEKKYDEGGKFVKKRKSKV